MNPKDRHWQHLLNTVATVQLNILRRGGRCGDEDDLRRLDEAMSAIEAAQRSVQYPSTIWDPEEPHRSQAQMQNDAEKAA